MCSSTRSIWACRCRTRRRRRLSVVKRRSSVVGLRLLLIRLLPPSLIWQLEEDLDLLWIADEALQAEDPEGWDQCESPNGDLYYVNVVSKQARSLRPSLRR